MDLFLAVQTPEGSGCFVRIHIWACSSNHGTRVPSHEKRSSFMKINPNMKTPPSCSAARRARS